MISQLRALWRYLFRRHQLDQDLAEELSAYADLVAAEKVRSGVSLDEARRDTHREMGGVEQVRQNVRDVRVGVWLEKLMHDLRYSLRALSRNSGFTVLGIYGVISYSVTRRTQQIGVRMALGATASRCSSACCSGLSD